MDETIRITNARNRVFETANGIAIGKNIPHALRTKENCVYRVTGMNQIQDILDCGFVRPRSGKVNGGHENEVFWSKGSDKLFYYNQSSVVLETLSKNMKDNQIGALPFEYLTGIWQYNDAKNAFENKIDFYRKVYEMSHNTKTGRSR